MAMHVTPHASTAVRTSTVPNVSNSKMCVAPLACGPQQMSAIPEDPTGVELWVLFKELQREQYKRFADLEMEVADLRQEVLSLQDLKVTDALDYAEAEVQDVRASLEKLTAKQDVDAVKLQHEQKVLSEQVKMLREVCADIGAAGDLEALSAQVERLETKLIADLESQLLSEVARVARKECDQERALQILQSRIDTWEKQIHCLKPADGYKTDPLQDLQAIVNRQLLEEHTKTSTTGLQPSMSRTSLLSKK